MLCFQIIACPKTKNNNKKITKEFQNGYNTGKRMASLLGEAVNSDYSFGVSAKLSSAFTHSFPSTNPLPSAK